MGLSECHTPSSYSPVSRLAQSIIIVPSYTAIFLNFKTESFSFCALLFNTTLCFSPWAINLSKISSVKETVIVVPQSRHTSTSFPDSHTSTRYWESRWTHRHSESLSKQGSLSNLVCYQAVLPSKRLLLVKEEKQHLVVTYLSPVYIGRKILCCNRKAES